MYCNSPFTTFSMSFLRLILVVINNCRLIEGQTTKRFKRHRRRFAKHDARSFTLRVVDNFHGIIGVPSVNFVATSDEDYARWIRVLAPLATQHQPPADSAGGSVCLCMRVL